MRNYISIKIMLLCIFVFLLQILFKDLTPELMLVKGEFFQRPWSPLTSIFVHANFLHLFYNMFALFLFGTILEHIIGRKKFISIYFASGLLASSVSYFVYPASLGASGAIYGILGMLAVLRPKMIVYVAYIPMPMILAAIFWAIGDIFGLFFPSNIANAAHLTGLFFGILCGFVLKQKTQKETKLGWEDFHR